MPRVEFQDMLYHCSQSQKTCWADTERLRGRLTGVGERKVALDTRPNGFITQLGLLFIKKRIWNRVFARKAPITYQGLGSTSTQESLDGNVETRQNQEEWYQCRFRQIASAPQHEEG